MSSVNKVILIGNVGKDPEVKYLDGNKAVAKLTLATSENYRDRNGQQVDQTEWHNLEFWDDLAKIVEKYVKKGNKIYVEGKIKTNKWVDKETNQERQTKYIRVSSLTMLGGGGQGGNEGESSYRGNTSNTSTNTSSQPSGYDNAPVPEPMPDDDLPF